MGIRQACKEAHVDISSPETDPKFVDFQALTTNFPASTDPFPRVNYKIVLDNHHDKRKLWRSLGYWEVSGLRL